MRYLTIGEVAGRAGLRTSTLRFYEAKGLLAPPPREHGERRYDPRVLRRLALIDVAKQAGFTLAEIRELLEGFDDDAPTSAQWRSLAARKLPQVQRIIQGAQTMQRLLREGPFSVRRAGGAFGLPSPFGYRRGPGLTHATLLFDTLLWKDSAGRMVPWLAERWTVSSDGTEFRFRLRPGVRWHDGSPLTAADVVFTFTYLSGGPGAGTGVLHLHGLDAVGEVRASGARSVIFRLPRPYAPFVEWVAGRMLVMPRHVWADVTDPADYRAPQATVGSGPYRPEGHQDTGGYAYRAVDDFFLGAPYVERLEFLPVDDQLAALSDGRIDGAEFVGDARRPGRDRLASFRCPAYEVRTGAGEWTRALHLDLTRFPYRARSFRHALAHAIDRDRLVERLLGGVGRPASHGGLAPSHPLADHTLADYEHDPALARRLLDDIGLVERGGDGRRHLPDGRQFTPVLLTDRGDPGVAELVRDCLRRVGLDVRVRRVTRAVADAAAISGRYDLLLATYGALGGDPDWLRIRCSARAVEQTHARVHGYCSRRFEELAEEQRTCLDPDRRARLVRRLQHVLADDLPAIGLYVPDRVEVTPAKKVVDAWHPTAGGVWGGYPGSLNKHALVTGNSRG